MYTFEIIKNNRRIDTKKLSTDDKEIAYKRWDRISRDIDSYCQTFKYNASAQMLYYGENLVSIEYCS